MFYKYRIVLYICILLNLIFGNVLWGQISVFNEPRRGCFYFNAGISNHTFSTSNLSVYQYPLGNNYTLNNFAATNLAHSSNFILNYYYCLGYFFNYNQRWAIEMCYEPLNYASKDGQKFHIKGEMNGNQVDSNLNFSKNNGYYYNLNNKAALVQFNFVKRTPVYRDKLRDFSADILIKAGFGPVFVNPQNDFGNKSNVAKFDNSGGWNYGASLGAKFTIHRYYFVEIAYKYTYAFLNNIEIYKGIINQNLTCSSIIFDIGGQIPTNKYNPLFRKGFKKPKYLPDIPEPRGDIGDTTFVYRILMMRDSMRRMFGQMPAAKKEPEFPDAPSATSQPEIPDVTAPKDSIHAVPNPIDTSSPEPIPAPKDTTIPTPPTVPKDTVVPAPPQVPKDTIVPAPVPIPVPKDTVVPAPQPDTTKQVPPPAPKDSLTQIPIFLPENQHYPYPEKKDNPENGPLLPPKDDYLLSDETYMFLRN